MYGHLSGAVDLEAGIHLLNQAHDSDVLDYCRIDAPIDCLSQELQRVLELSRFNKRVESEVDPNATGMGNSTRRFELIQCELRAFVPSVESLRSQVYGIGAVRDGCANGVKRPRWGKKLR